MGPLPPAGSLTFADGITVDPHANTLVAVPESAVGQSVKTKRYRNGAWETMPMADHWFAGQYRAIQVHGGDIQSFEFTWLSMIV